MVIVVVGLELVVIDGTVGELNDWDEIIIVASGGIRIRNTHLLEDNNIFR
jgi:hypothetical protein